MSPPTHQFPLLSLPTEIVSHIGLFCIDYRLALPSDALNNILRAIFHQPHSIAHRALRNFSSPELALAAEAVKGDVAVLEIIIRHVRRINRPFYFRTESKYNLDFNPTAIARAVLGGHVEAVKLLLAHGATMTTLKNRQTRFDFELLCAAARSPHVDLLRLVASQIDDPAESTSYMWYSVYRAAGGNTHAGRDMLLALYEVHAPSSALFLTVLNAAAQSGNIGVVNLLAEDSRTVPGRSVKLEYKFHWEMPAEAAATRGYIEILDAISEMKEDSEGRDMFSLEMAAKYGPTYLVKRLLKERPDSYAIINPSIVQIAAKRRYAGPLKALLDAWCPPSVVLDPTNLSKALSAACTTGSIDSVQHLWERGAAIEAFMFTDPVKLGHIDVVDFLLTIWEHHGGPAPDDQTVLTAAQRNHLELIKLLLRRHPPSCGLVPQLLESSAQWGRPDVVELVITMFPDSFVESDPWVQKAATYRAHTSTMEALLNLRVKRVITFDVERLILAAARKGHTGVVRAILWRGVIEASALYQLEEFWSAVKEGFTTHLAFFFLKFGDFSEIKTAAKRLLPIAGKFGRVRVLKKLLLPRGMGKPFVDITDTNNNALIFATESGIAETVAFLLKLGLNVDAHVDSAMEAATARGDYDVVNVLNLYRAKVTKQRME